MTKKYAVMVDMLLVVRCATCGLVVRGADVAVERGRALEQVEKCGAMVITRFRSDNLNALRASAGWAGRACIREQQLESLADACAGYQDFGCDWCAQVERNREQLASAQLPLPLEVSK